MALGSFLLSVFALVLIPLVRNGFCAELTGPDWYQSFADTIFKPQSAYYAESILVPLVAKLTGAAASVGAYKLFAFTLAIVCLVLLAVLISNALSSPPVIVAVSCALAFFPAIKYWVFWSIGFPDPVTAVALCMAVLLPGVRGKSLAILVAGVSHFSLMIAALPGILLINASAKNVPLLRVYRDRGIICMAVAALTAKLVLLTWNFTFSYQLLTRLAGTSARGLGFYIALNKQQIFDFYSVLGPTASAITIIFCVVALFKRRYGDIAAIVTSLLCAYTAHYFTLDRPRIFGIIYIAPYVYMLIALGRDLEGLWSRWGSTGLKWGLVGGGLLAVVLAGDVHRRVAPEGLRVTYFKGTNFKVPAWRGVERELVRDFQDDPPVPWLRILSGGFSSRWTGFLNVPRDDDYVFYGQSSDGLRFYLDDRCVLDNWRRQDFTSSGTAAKLHLTAGLHPLKVEHFSHDMSGALRVRWCGGGLPENTLLAAPYLRKYP